MQDAKGKTVADTWSRNFALQKEKPFHTKNYLEILAHYDAELILRDGRILVVRRKTGTELPLEERAKRLVTRQLLDEFGTIDQANRAVKNYKNSRY